MEALGLVEKQNKPKKALEKPMSRKMSKTGQAD